MTTEKDILDVTCGGRMMWFDKLHPDVLFTDIREEEHELCDGRRFIVSPDMIADFRNLPFDDDTFNMVVMDPPHLKRVGETSFMFKKYGALAFNWETHISQGFKEAFRVLKDRGTLIFKWNEDQIKVSDVIPLAGRLPLVGTRTGHNNKTMFLVFMK